MTNDRSDFTQGNILKKLVSFMMPILGALILQAAYGAVDLLVVGRFGSTAGLSAVSTGSQVLNLVTFVVVQFGYYSSDRPLSGRKKTRKDRSCYRRRCNCVYNDFGCAVCYNGSFCTSDFCADAGAGISRQSYIQLCTYLWRRYFLYCSLQPAVCNFSWTG